MYGPNLRTEVTGLLSRTLLPWAVRISSGKKFPPILYYLEFPFRACKASRGGFVLIPHTSTRMELQEAQWGPNHQRYIQNRYHFTGVNRLILASVTSLLEIQI